MPTGKSDPQPSISNLSIDDTVNMESEKEEKVAETQSEKCDCGTNEGEKLLEHDTGKTDNIVEVEVKDKDETERLIDESKLTPNHESFSQIGRSGWRHLELEFKMTAR